MLALSDVSPLPQPWYNQRRHALDWLRVLAFALLIFYHLAMAYVADWGFHIKSLYLAEWLKLPMLWSNPWRMSLLFFISGAAISYQLHRHHGWKFLTGNARKLILPLLFGSAVIVAPQSWIEAKLAGAIGDMGYWEFWRNYVGYSFGFGEPLSGYRRLEVANIIWNHLWYLLYLFTYIAILWLLYPLLMGSRITKFSITLAERAPRVMLYLFPLGLFFAINLWLGKHYPISNTWIGDWFNHARYLCVFIMGFALVRSERWWQAFADFRHWSLGMAVCTYIGVVLYDAGCQLKNLAPFLANFETPVRSLVWSADGWLWIMAIIGYAQVWLNRPSALIQSANGAVYCWYILHQTLIVIGVYALRTYEVGPVWEPLLVTLWVVGGCLMGYQLVKNLPVIRELMGVFPAKTASMESCPRRSPCSRQ